MDKAPETELVKQLRQYLNARSRVTISDGRKFVGNFVCIDKGRNMILSFAEEFHPDTVEGRFVGLIMIPGNHLMKVELENPDGAYM
ncbi:hypothetical protein DFS34DRAFT_585279 [Phlyctochytrium arcticum]|nr:hypothetical protein DFS34DRAFT_585279 [Phlyctochytrium arcticum]